jgi:hypothetical protein
VFVGTDLRMNIRKKMLLLVVALVLIVLVGALATFNFVLPGNFRKIVQTPMPTIKPTSTSALEVIATPTTLVQITPFPVRGVPVSSASAITSPPLSMDCINTHVELYGQDADPNMITLGPKVGSHPEKSVYSTKVGMEFELENATPILAPLDMVFVGFSDTSADYRIQNGVKQSPYNDLKLCFESASPDWPGMIVVVYHLLSSPLLPGQKIDYSRGEWLSIVQTQGHVFYSFDDYVITEKGNASSYNALIGYTVKRGELIGFAGSVGNHSMAPFCFKVEDSSENPTVQNGNHYLHWVQPGSFFYWKSYSPSASFASGVLAYPFECEGYQIPAEQRDVNFKYIPNK